MPRFLLTIYILILILTAGAGYLMVFTDPTLFNRLLFLSIVLFLLVFVVSVLRFYFLKKKGGVQLKHVKPIFDDNSIYRKSLRWAFPIGVFLDLLLGLKILGFVNVFTLVLWAALFIYTYINKIRKLG